jgi:pilus assembly protein Flp/PilA
MLNLYIRTQNFLKSEDGQDLAEYALLIGLIALALVGGVTYLGGGIDATFRAIGDTVTNWAVPAGP